MVTSSKQIRLLAASDPKRKNTCFQQLPFGLGSKMNALKPSFHEPCKGERGENSLLPRFFPWNQWALGLPMRSFLEVLFKGH